MVGADDDPLDNTADVETPERIRFRYQVAGPVRRALAYGLDMAIRLMILFGAAARTTGVGDMRASQGLWLVLLFVLDWGYGVLFESLWNGKTPGKRALGLRVVQDGGYQVGFIDALLRNLLRAADFLPLGYVLGLLSMASDRTAKRIGDRVAGTMVVIERAGGIAAPIALTPAAPASGRAHAALYSAPPYRLGAIVDLGAREFPRTVRRYWKFVVIAAALFAGPGLVGFVGTVRSQGYAPQILPEAPAAQMRESYSHDPSEGRTGSDNAFMAGFYVNNNIGIAFRCFATGILFGLGSMFFLVYNGLMIGTVAGFVQSAGFGRNLLTFIVGHGAFELPAIVISGAAGMVMGYALVETAGLTRFGSLRRRARDLAQLLMGVAVMLAIAACLEGFWSPSHVPRPVKLAVAALLWAVGRGPAGALCLLARFRWGWSWGLVWTLAVGLSFLCQAPFTVAYSD